MRLLAHLLQRLVPDFVTALMTPHAAELRRASQKSDSHLLDVLLWAIPH